MKIIVLFDLKPGVDPAEYEAWARTRDVPNVRALGSVASFTVHRATGLFGSEDAPPVQYVEVIDAPDLAAFTADVSTPEFQALAAPFADYVDNPRFVLTEEL